MSSHLISSGGDVAIFFCARHCCGLFDLIHSAILEVKSLKLLRGSVTMVLYIPGDPVDR